VWNFWSGRVWWFLERTIPYTLNLTEKVYPGHEISPWKFPLKNYEKPYTNIPFPCMDLGN